MSGQESAHTTFFLFVCSTAARCPGLISPDSLEPRPQWVRNSCRVERTEVQGRQSREEPHPFSGPQWKERQLTETEAQGVVSTALLPGSSQRSAHFTSQESTEAQGHPGTQPRSRFWRARPWELTDFGVQPLLSPPWQPGFGSAQSSREGSHPFRPSQIPCA